MDEWLWRISGNINSLSLDQNWHSLGYDVADASLISSVCNCGFGKERAAIRIFEKPLSDFLNGDHLFSDLNAALEYANFSDKAVPEHAPFFAYEIFKTNRARSLFYRSEIATPG